jgi:peptide chain release factor 2
MTLDGFWDNTEKASLVQKEKSFIEKTLNEFQALIDLFEENDLFLEYAKTGDVNAAIDGINHSKKILSYFEVLEKKVLLSEEHDKSNAIISINAGAGGTESCDWAQMLFRMVKRWAEDKGFVVKVFDHQYGDGAGLKSVTFSVEGDYAYGSLKSETGIHRLVRISPFDSNARRHTSFASIFVSPEVDDTIEIEVLDKDLKIDVYRSGGAGGQSVNTTDSAVRMTHLPSGIVVTCQNERSQIQNRATALKILKSRLYEKELEARMAAQRVIEDNKKEIGWGSQIRSYVLHPYKLVKDHRTEFESSNAEGVLEGELDPFIHAYLQWNAMSHSSQAEK